MRLNSLTLPKKFSIRCRHLYAPRRWREARRGRLDLAPRYNIAPTTPIDVARSCPEHGLVLADRPIFRFSCAAHCAILARSGLAAHPQLFAIVQRGCRRHEERRADDETGRREAELRGLALTFGASLMPDRPLGHGRGGM